MEGQEGERTAPQGPLTLGGLEGPVETSAYPWEDRCLEVEKRTCSGFGGRIASGRLTFSRRETRHFEMCV